MNKKKNYPATIYWCGEKEEAPGKLRDVFSGHPYQKPGRLLNSSKVQAEGKPWLQQKKRKVQPEKVDENTIDDNTYTNHTGCTLKDLGKEDKKKVANLVKELAKFGEEKENALQEIEQIKESYETRLQKLQKDRQKSIKEHDKMKEKLLEYEIELMRFHSNSIQNAPNTADNIKQSSLRKTTDGQAENALKQLKNVVNHVSVIKSGDSAVNKSKVDCLNEQRVESPSFNQDSLSEIFHEQQHQFAEQQKVLSEQLQQLQALQQSVIQQQCNQHATMEWYPLPQHQSIDKQHSCQHYLLPQHSLLQQRLQQQESLQSQSLPTKSLHTSHNMSLQYPIRENSQHQVQVAFSHQNPPKSNVQPSSQQIVNAISEKLQQHYDCLNESESLSVNYEPTMPLTALPKNSQQLQHLKNDLKREVELSTELLLKSAKENKTTTALDTYIEKESKETESTTLFQTDSTSTSSSEMETASKTNIETSTQTDSTKKIKDPHRHSRKPLTALNRSVSTTTQTENTTSSSTLKKQRFEQNLLSGAHTSSDFSPLKTYESPTRRVKYTSKLLDLVESSSDSDDALSTRFRHFKRKPELKPAAVSSLAVNSRSRNSRKSCLKNTNDQEERKMLEDIFFVRR